MRSIYVSLSCGVVALALSAPAYAQSVPADVENDELEDNQPIILAHEPPPQTIIVTGAPQLLSDLANSVTQITQRDLQRIQLPVLSDVLSRQAGVTVTRNGPVGGFSAVRIRGADASQTLVVINGVRVGDPTSPSGGFDFGSLLAGNINSIDIQRGSNSVTWGSDAIGGVVLVETGGRSGVAAEYGSNDTRRISGQWSANPGRFSLSAGGGYYSTNGISAARNGMEADGFRHYTANVGAEVEVTETVTLGATAIYANSRLNLDGFAPPTFSFGDTDEFQRAEELYTAATLVHRLGNYTHRLTFAVADINRDTFDPAASSTPSFLARGRTERLAYQGQLRADPLELVGGVDREWSRSRTASTFSSDQGRTAITGVFGNATLAISDRLRLGIGARHDDHRQFGGNSVVSANGRFEVSERIAVYASFAEGFKAPTLFQLSDTPGGFGNPALQPERSRGSDIGIVFQDWNYSLRATIFRRDSRNLIDFVGCTGAARPAICGTGTRPFGTYANIARARAEGLELEAVLRPSDALTLTGAYSFIDTRDRSIGRANSGNRLARRPVHSGSISLDYAADGFTVGGDVQIIGDSFDDAGNFTRLDGYALANVRGSVALNRRIELYGRIENLFDTAYQNVAGYGTYGRTATLGARARF